MSLDEMVTLTKSLQLSDVLILSEVLNAQKQNLASVLNTTIQTKLKEEVKQ